MYVNLTELICKTSEGKMKTFSKEKKNLSDIVGYSNLPDLPTFKEHKKLFNLLPK